MGYLVDALAAERDKGARFANAFAFAPHDGTLAGHDKARDSWLAKNVKPILYDSREGHRLLGDTLIEWARIRSDPSWPGPGSHSTISGSCRQGLTIQWSNGSYGP